MHANDAIEATPNRCIQWMLVLALATLALAAIGSQPAAAAADDSLSKSDVLYMCRVSGGMYWEVGDTYGCRMPGGITVECNANGCTYWCYETLGCRCDLHGDDVICIHGFTPNESDAPWDDAVHMDPYQEVKLPDPTETPSDPVVTPGTSIDDDQVTKGLG